MVRNPTGTFCAMSADITEGAAIATVAFSGESIVDYMIVEALDEHNPDVFYAQRLNLLDGTIEGIAVSMQRSGIVPLPAINDWDQGWSTGHFSFVNTQENRMLVVQWLLNHQHKHSIETARLIMEEYVGEFVEIYIEEVNRGMFQVRTRPLIQAVVSGGFTMPAAVRRSV